LLGKKTGGRARITKAVFYDDLDPQVFDSGIVRFEGRYFGRLWDICQEQGLTVVADVHTHPGAACQSHSDQTHPMIAKPGHISVILPQYAAKSWVFHHVGVYQYLYGEHTKNWGERECIRHIKKVALERNECSVLKITPKPVVGIKINGQSFMSGNAITR